MRYDAGAIESKWQRAWDEAGLFAPRTIPSRPKFYVLEMFPYPSGRIHMGHVRNYAIGDVVARYKAARGFNVLHPMGWDAFGLPAENAAIEMGVPPAEWTYRNIAAMRAQMKPLGFSIDWSREFATCDPEYYGQQQALFLDMLDAGLVTRKAAVVNWDPVDMTVLANEQVIDGKGWRSGAPVERRELVAVVLPDLRHGRGAARGARRPRALAGEGAHHAAQLDRPEPRAAVRLRDRGGAGRLRGARGLHHPSRHALGRELRRGLARPPAGAGARGRPGRCRLPRRVPALGTSEEEIETAEKKGFDTGIRVRHPFDPAWELPVYIANFILMDYGTGAIFGCPAHDQRDLDFARKYGLAVVDVFAAPDSEARVGTEAYVPPKSEAVDYLRPVALGPDNSSRMTGEAALEAAIDFCEARGIGRGRRQVPPPRLGPVAPALLGLPDPDRALPGLRRRAREAREPAGAAARRRDLRQAGQRPRPPPDLGADDLPRLRRRGAARDRHHGHLRRFVAGTTPASPRRTRRGRPTSPRPTTG